MKIEELTSSIKREEIVMPEFQREFVWNKARIRELVQSLLNSYPVGGILVWKTDNPPQLKGLTFKKDIETMEFNLESEKKISIPFTTLTIFDSPDLQKKASEIWVKQFRTNNQKKNNFSRLGTT